MSNEIEVEEGIVNPRMQRLQEAKEAVARYRAKEPEVLDGMRGPSGEKSVPIENILPDPDYPAWLLAKFKDPKKVVIFQSFNPGLMLTLKKSRTFFDADMQKQEEPGALANFAKTHGFFPTDDEELIEIIRGSRGYGSEFWDIEDAKKAHQEQNFQAFAADVADNPELLERLVKDNPEKVRMLFKKFGVQGGDAFKEAGEESKAQAESTEKSDPKAPKSKGKRGRKPKPKPEAPSDEGDDFD